MAVRAPALIDTRWRNENERSRNGLGEKVADAVGPGRAFFGVIWTVISIAMVGGSINVAGSVRVFWQIVLPLCALGLVWGWSERLDLERWSAQSSAKLQMAIETYVFRQIGKAVICGGLFLLFTHAVGMKRFKSWNNEDDIITNITSVLVGVLIAAVVGAFVGVFSKRNLVRKLSEPVV